MPAAAFAPGGSGDLPATPAQGRQTASPALALDSLAGANAAATQIAQWATGAGPTATVAFAGDSANNNQAQTGDSDDAANQMVAAVAGPAWDNAADASSDGIVDVLAGEMKTG